jgi:D-alanyl-D-alanine carboxypeptidase/D-alanyl-D-alanine-endopeptidase (penicillin-binding protein 4)
MLLTVLSAALAPTFSQSTPAPLLQDIKVVNDRRTTPTPTPTPLVQKTGNSTPAVPSTIHTSIPALAEIQIPGYTGIVVESLDGKTVLESNAGLTFNPASNVKVATSYSVLKTFGPEFRFLTNVYTDGVVDNTTGTLVGNLYVSGKDPIFGYEHAIALANELNRMGIRLVSGNLIVTENFAMNYSNSSLRSAQELYSAMDSTKRSPAATRVWLNYLSSSGRFGQVSGIPDITFAGAAYVQPIPSNLRLLFTHESTKLRDIVKATMCYSNNFLAERLGEMLGGPYAVSRFVQQNAGIAPSDFSIQTSSGLGYNRVTPNAMMRLLRALRGDLARYKMTFADIMPVAGIDKGTLENRFDNDFAAGSVVGKTGTLGNTDAGVSALSGEINTRQGKFLFVIFNQHGNVHRFRLFQNNFVSLVQGLFGGALPMGYQPTPLDVLLARSRISNPRGQYN